MNGQPENKKTTILKTDKLPQPNKIKQEIKLSLTVVYLNGIQTNHKSQLDMEGQFDHQTDILAILNDGEITGEDGYRDREGNVILS